MPSVSAEYSSALPVGEYRVEAIAIDAAGLTSGPTAQLTFYVTTQIQLDAVLLWDVIANNRIDVVLLWDVIANGQKDLALLWDVYKETQIDLTVLWDVSTFWEDVALEDDVPAPTWELVIE